MKNKKTIVIALVLVIALGLLAFFVLNTDSANDEIAESSVIPEQTADENERTGIGVEDDEIVMERIESRYPNLDDETRNEELITSELPSNFPIPGGEIQMFRDSVRRIDLRMSVGSTIEEVYEWFETNLANTPWEIQDTALDDLTAGMEIHDGTIGGTIKMEERQEIQTDIMIFFN